MSPRGDWETKAVEQLVNRTSARVSVVRGSIVQSGSVKMAEEQVRKMEIDVSFSHNHFMVVVKNNIKISRH
jgi:hypothetical protein